MSINLKRAMVVSMVAVFIASAFGATLFVDDAYADTPIEITDSTGKTITLDAPANKVATLGYGFTRTVIDLGGQDKIVAYDSYSKDVADEYNISGANVGSSYSSNKTVIYSTMVQLKESGNFDINTDIVIINNYSGTIEVGETIELSGTRKMLEDEGFKVLCFGADTYDDVLFIVENIAKAIGKESSEALTEMISARNDAFEAGKDITDEDKVTALYVNEYSGTLRIYNEGIAVSMIELAGGKNIGRSGTGTYYATEASTILQLNPDVVFLDGNYSMTAEEFQQDVLRTTSIDVIKMEKDWNNYCPSAAEGLRVVSDAMLADYDDDDSLWSLGSISTETIVVVSIVVIAIVAISALFVIRSRS